MPNDDFRPPDKMRQLPHDGLADKAFVDETSLLDTIYQSDDTHAGRTFETLVQPYERQLRQFAECHLGGAQHLAQEALQRMRLSVWKRLRARPFEIQPGKTFGAYLHRSIRNAVIDILHHERNHVPLDALQAEVLATDSAIPSISPSSQSSTAAPWEDNLSPTDINEMSWHQLSRTVRESANVDPMHGASSDMLFKGEINRYDRDGRSAVMRATASLSQPRRDCFLLAYEEGLKHDLIGSMVGLSESQVNSHIFEAKEQVRAVLSYLWREEEGYSSRQIAAELKIQDTDVETYVRRGRKIYTRARD